MRALLGVGAISLGFLASAASCGKGGASSSSTSTSTTTSTTGAGGHGAGGGGQGGGGSCVLDPETFDADLDAATFGAVGDGATEAGDAIQAALDAAGMAVKGHRVRLRLAAGKFKSARRLSVPNQVVFSGAGPEMTTISFTNKTYNGNTNAASAGIALDGKATFANSQYLPIARADDPAHAALSASGYRGESFVYLHDPAQVAALRALGVPVVATPGFALRVTVTSGATLGNDYHNPGEPPVGTPPLGILQGDGQVNPTPAEMTFVLAAADDGKVTLIRKNRHDWGRYAHPASEALADYYAPSQASMDANLITGPAWLIPMTDYAHDVTLSDMALEFDPAKIDQLLTFYPLTLGYAYNVEVARVAIDNSPSWDISNLIRIFNFVLRDSTIHIYGAGLEMDSGNDYKLIHDEFIGGAWPNGPALGIPSQAVNLLSADEAPSDMFVMNSKFSHLPWDPAQTNGAVGAMVAGISMNHLTMVDNQIDGIERWVAGGCGEGLLFDSNTLTNTNAELSWCPDPGVAFTANVYSGPTAYTEVPVFNDAAGRGVACGNHGVNVFDWGAPPGLLAANFDAQGSPISSVKSIMTANATVPTPADALAEHPVSLSLATACVAANQLVPLTVTLSAPAAVDTPFHIIESDGDFGTVNIVDHLLFVPAGQSSLTLDDTILALRPGRVTLSVRPLCSTDTTPATAELVVTR